MAQLLDLPNEVLHSVFSFLHPVRDTGVLLSLCLTSKKIYALTQPLLFNEYIREICCPHCHECKFKPGRMGPLLYFTKTIINRPSLGANVCRLVINACEGSHDDLKGWPEATASSTIQTMTKGVQQLAAEDKAHALLNIVGMKTNPLLVLLVSYTPNIKYLEIKLGNEGLENLSPLFTPSPEGPLRSAYLANLKWLFIKDFQQMKNTSMKELFQFLTLPKLETFSMAFCDGNSEGCPYFDLAPGSLNLTTLSLLQASLDAERLGQLVRACKCLKNFVYEAFSSNAHDPESCQFGATELVSILASQRNNLEMIRVDLDVADPTYHELEECPKYDSFAVFPNLKHLEVEQGLISSIGDLPRSLETIMIRLCEYPVYDMVGELVKHSKENLPNLHLVMLQPKFTTLNGMLGLPRNIDCDDRTVTTCSYREKLRHACERLERIAKEGTFEFLVMSSVWNDYQIGVF